MGCFSLKHVRPHADLRRGGVQGEMSLTRRSSAGMIVAAILATTTLCYADVAIPDVLGDGMVLLRDHRVPVWGTASPDELITVSFSGQVKKTRAGKDGRWRVDLDR